MPPYRTSVSCRCDRMCNLNYDEVSLGLTCLTDSVSSTMPDYVI